MKWQLKAGHWNAECNFFSSNIIPFTFSPSIHNLLLLHTISTKIKTRFQVHADLRAPSSWRRHHGAGARLRGRHRHTAGAGGANLRKFKTWCGLFLRIIAWGKWTVQERTCFFWHIQSRDGFEPRLEPASPQARTLNCQQPALQPGEPDFLKNKV